MMPCRDEWYTPPEPYETYDFMEAALCGVFTELVKRKQFVDVVESMDFAEMGVDKHDLLVWWKAHQKKDAARRKKEAEEKRKAELREQALAKLTSEERKVLGIK
jgi:hypothetical protein